MFGGHSSPPKPTLYFPQFKIAYSYFPTLDAFNVIFVAGNLLPMIIKLYYQIKPYCSKVKIQN